MSIDQLPPSEALESLRKARTAVVDVISSNGGKAPFEEIVTQMKSDGFGAYDTRLALASAGALIGDDGDFALL